ncbi:MULTISPECIES: YybH family protein [Aequorivita]|uniref:Nuclear transport factor 2 family protein n=1 Tax=Aequorivita iocasae TaxID=2803865 RepID=A0ABX7DSP0_9FLAO|nr:MULTISPECIES: nuclear transport factor 2 family protein [Aequorivita]QQX77166.1 nuclear transport factor 2 family protein [Aequorivita iocasae]UCA56654.1 nuclear transport factor 2 family protein [Aequorivita sp. F7]
MKLKYLIVFAIFWACNKQKENNTEQSLQQIIKADKETSVLASEIGFNSALLSVADSSFVKLGNGQLPILGKTAFANSFEKDNDLKTITWNPVKGEVAESGELGYTWGDWQFKTPDTTYYGNYVTIWKKKEDGNWKMALDGGNSTPNPKL